MAEKINGGSISLNAKRMKTSDIDNTELLEAIRDMRAEFNAEKQNKVINLALRGTFFVPAVFGKDTELVEDKDHKVRFEDKQTAKFLLITNKEKQSFFPAFTDIEAIKTFKTEQKFQAFAMKFADLANLTEKTPKVSGFVLNPNSENLPFTKEMLDSIKKVLIEATARAKEQKAAAEAESKPNITVSTNEHPEE